MLIFIKIEFLLNDYNNLLIKIERPLDALFKIKPTSYCL